MFRVPVASDKNSTSKPRCMMAPFANEFVAVTPESHRALPAEELRERIEALTGVSARCGGDVKSGLAMLTKAREKAETTGLNIDFQLADARNLPFEQEFDMEKEDLPTLFRRLLEWLFHLKGADFRNSYFQPENLEN